MITLPPPKKRVEFLKELRLDVNLQVFRSSWLLLLNDFNLAYTEQGQSFFRSYRETFWLQLQKQAHDVIKCDNTDDYLNNLKIIL
jgi:hypothetical protein